MKSLYASWVASSRERAGHWYWYHRALRRSCKTTFTAGLRAKGLEVDFPVLPRSSYRRGFDRFPRGVYRTAVRALSKVLTEEKFDSLIIYEAEAFEFQVAVELAKQHPTVSFFINLFGPSSWSRVLESRENSTKTVEKSDHPCVKNVFLSADNPPMANYLEALTPFPVSVFPVFSTQFFQSEIRPEKELQTPDEWAVLIGSRGDFQFALEVCRALTTAFPKKRLHIIFQPRAGFSQQEIHDFGDRLDGVTGARYHSYLNSGEYSEILQRVSAMALLYSPFEYKMRSSGRLEDCLLFDVIPIVARGTALSFRSDFVEGFAYDWENPQSVVESFSRLVPSSDSQLSLSENGRLPSHLPTWLAQISRAKSQASCPVCVEREFSLAAVTRFRESYVHELGNSLVRTGLRRP